MRICRAFAAVAAAVFLLCACSADTSEGTVSTEAVPSEQNDEQVYYTGTPKLSLVAKFEDNAAEVCSPTALHIAFIKDEQLSSEIDDWLNATLSELLEVRENYISSLSQKDGFDKVHGSISSRTTYETCDIELINGYMSIVLGYRDNRTVFSDNVTVWCGCRTAVFDLVNGRRITDFSELFPDDCRAMIESYINTTYKEQLNNTEPEHSALNSFPYHLPQQPLQYTLTTAVSESGTSYGIQLPLGFECMARSKISEPRDFSDYVTFAVTKHRSDNFGFAETLDGGTRYIYPVSSLEKSETEMAEFSESRLSLAREFCEKYKTVCGSAPLRAEYGCALGDVMFLHIDKWYLTISEEGLPLTLADFISGGEYVITATDESAALKDSAAYDLSEYYVFTCYQGAEMVYFNAWSLNETAGAETVIINVAVEPASARTDNLDIFL